MYFQPVTTCQLSHGMHVRSIQRASITSVMGVFKNNQPCYRKVNVVLSNCRFYVMESHLAVRLVGYSAWMYAA